MMAWTRMLTMKSFGYILIDILIKPINMASALREDIGAKNMSCHTGRVTVFKRMFVILN